MGTAGAVGVGRRRGGVDRAPPDGKAGVGGSRARAPARGPSGTAAHRHRACGRRPACPGTAARAAGPHGCGRGAPGCARPCRFRHTLARSTRSARHSRPIGPTTSTGAAPEPTHWAVFPRASGSTSASGATAIAIVPKLRDAENRNECSLSVVDRVRRPHLQPRPTPRPATITITVVARRPRPPVGTSSLSGRDRPPDAVRAQPARPSAGSRLDADLLPPRRRTAWLGPPLGFSRPASRRERTRHCRVREEENHATHHSRVGGIRRCPARDLLRRVGGSRPRPRRFCQRRHLPWAIPTGQCHDDNEGSAERATLIYAAAVGPRRSGGHAGRRRSAVGIHHDLGRPSG